MSDDDPHVPYFLGMCLRAARRGFGTDLLGVTNLVLSPFFPRRLSGLHYVLGLRGSALTALRADRQYHCRIVMTDKSRQENRAWSDLHLSLVDPGAGPEPSSEDEAADPQRSEEGGAIALGRLLLENDGGPARRLEIVSAPAPPLYVLGPCSIRVEAEVRGTRYEIGQFVCEFSPPPPLTDDERRAIASRPKAIKAVSVRLICNHCGSEAEYFTQLDPLRAPSTKLPPGAIPIQEAPAAWSCTCGRNVIDLKYLKEGLHDAFRRLYPGRSDDPVLDFAPLYEAGRIDGILEDYERLLDSTKEEESLQTFLEQYPVLWSFLSPKRILHKPAVLTHKRADFGVLTTHGILYLVEIEKPGTRLTNKDGAISAEIQRGANQIYDWEAVVTEHREAVLSELGLAGESVHDIRYILIGGVSRRTTAPGLAKLRRSGLAPKTTFYCFDELGSFLHTVASELRAL